MSKKSNYKKLMTESTFVKTPREGTTIISNNTDAFDFFTSRRVFGEKTIDEALSFSSPEAKQHVDKDLVLMSNHLGKASQQVIKIMMDGVKGGRYDALDIQRGIEFGPFNRTHEGERPFMKMLWNKVRKGFRRYMPKGKLRK